MLFVADRPRLKLSLSCSYMAKGSRLVVLLEQKEEEKYKMEKDRWRIDFHIDIKMYFDNIIDIDIQT